MTNRPLPVTFLFLAVLVLIGACSSNYFYPSKKIFRTPDQIGLEYDALNFSAADGTELSAWLLRVPADTQRRGVIYFLHGNAENISTHIYSVRWLPATGYDVFMLDYRGYGVSAGKPELPEVLDDISAGFSVLLGEYPEGENIYFLGQSIGASLGVTWIANSADAQQHIQKVVLDAPFSSFPTMVEDVLQRSWLTYLFAKPVSWFFSDKYDPASNIEGFPRDKPILVFHSRDDRVIPFEQGEVLYEMLPGPKRKIVSTGPHGATFNFLQGREVLQEFLSQ